MGRDERTMRWLRPLGMEPGPRVDVTAGVLAELRQRRVERAARVLHMPTLAVSAGVAALAALAVFQVVWVGGPNGQEDPVVEFLSYYLP